MAIKAERFYNCIAFIYPVIDIFLKKQKKALIKEVDCLPYGHVLEIGVGNGRHLKWYKTQKVTGIDISSGMLKYALKNKNSRINLIKMNGEELCFTDESFDYVTIIHTLAVVDYPDVVLNEVYRVLKPGGKLFILNHFTPDNWLKYFDIAASMFSSLLHLKSVFYLQKIKSINKFKLIRETKLGIFSYYKLLIFDRE